MKASKLLTAVSVSLIMSSLLTSLSATPAQAQVVKWFYMPGIIQANNVVGTGTGQVTGGGQPWSTLKGNTVVNLGTGQLSFVVRGLVLAGGNGVGTTGGITSVKGTLVCDTNGSLSGDSVLVDTAAIPLTSVGNADFGGNVGVLPPECAEPDIAFLIRIVSNNRWIANGAQRFP